MNPTPPSARGSRHVCSGELKTPLLVFTMTQMSLSAPEVIICSRIQSLLCTLWLLLYNQEANDGVCWQETASHSRWVHHQSGSTGHRVVHLSLQTQPCVQGVWCCSSGECGECYSQQVEHTIKLLNFLVTISKLPHSCQRCSFTCLCKVCFTRVAYFLYPLFAINPFMPHYATKSKCLFNYFHFYFITLSSSIVNFKKILFL